MVGVIHSQITGADNLQVLFYRCHMLIHDETPLGLRLSYRGMGLPQSPGGEEPKRWLHALAHSSTSYQLYHLIPHAR